MWGGEIETTPTFINFLAYFYILAGFHQILRFLFNPKPDKNEKELQESLDDLMDLGRDTILTSSSLTISERTHISLDSDSHPSMYAVTAHFSRFAGSLFEWTLNTSLTFSSHVAEVVPVVLKF